jgi:lysyl-tRNA synthetase class 2
MASLQGRVLEAFRDGDVAHVVIIFGVKRRAFKLHFEIALPAPGSLVAVEVDEHQPGVVRSLIHLGGPDGGTWDPQSDVLRWRAVRQKRSRLELLRDRQEILREIRDDLYAQEFLEVQTPLLVPTSCPDLHIDSIPAQGGYLVTSTEYQLKRLIVGGVDKLFSLTQNFRAGDLGPRHNPEFTMLEWARAFAPLAAIEEDVERFTRRAFLRLHKNRSELSYRGASIDMTKPWERLTVREAFERYLGVVVASDFSLTSLARGAERAGLEVPEFLAQDAHSFTTYLLELVQPHLGQRVPLFLHEWPAFMTSSAELQTGNPALAERSELFIGGLEIADGFPSLRDVKTQEALFARELSRRAACGKPAIPIDTKYLEALRQGIPPGAGMALGIDRLVMVLTEQDDIRDVLAFAWDER